MAARSSKVCTALLLFAAPLFAGSALAQGPNMQATTNIAPIRPEFTRPAGMPGAPRQIAGEQEIYLRAVPVEPVVTKKKRRRH
jgi:hypothetical protein